MDTILGQRLNRAEIIAAGWPRVRQRRQRHYRSALREDRRLTCTILGPQLYLAVVAGARQPPVRENPQDPDRATV